MLNQEDQGSSSRDSTAWNFQGSIFGSSDSVGVGNVIVEFWWEAKVNLEGVFGKKCVLIYVHTCIYIYILNVHLHNI